MHSLHKHQLCYNQTLVCLLICPVQFIWGGVDVNGNSDVDQTLSESKNVGISQLQVTHLHMILYKLQCIKKM